MTVSFTEYSHVVSDYNSDEDTDYDELDGTWVPDVCHKHWLLSALSDLVKWGAMTPEQSNHLVTWEGNIYESFKLDQRARDANDVGIRPVGAEFPSVVVQSGTPGSEEQILDEAGEWFQRSAGAVQQVIILIWNIQNYKLVDIEVDVYVYDPRSSSGMARQSKETVVPGISNEENTRGVEFNIGRLFAHQVPWASLKPFMTYFMTTHTLIDMAQEILDAEAKEREEAAEIQAAIEKRRKDREDEEQRRIAARLQADLEEQLRIDEERRERRRRYEEAERKKHAEMQAEDQKRRSNRRKDQTWVDRPFPRPPISAPSRPHPVTVAADFNGRSGHRNPSHSRREHRRLEYDQMVGTTIPDWEESSPIDDLDDKISDDNLNSLDAGGFTAGLPGLSSPSPPAPEPYCGRNESGSQQYGQESAAGDEESGDCQASATGYEEDCSEAEERGYYPVVRASIKTGLHARSMMTNLGGVGRQLVMDVSCSTDFGSIIDSSVQTQSTSIESVPNDLENHVRETPGPVDDSSFLSSAAPGSLLDDSILNVDDRGLDHDDVARDPMAVSSIELATKLDNGALDVLSDESPLPTKHFVDDLKAQSKDLATTSHISPNSDIDTSNPAVSNLASATLISPSGSTLSQTHKTNDEENLDSLCPQPSPSQPASASASPSLTSTSADAYTSNSCNNAGAEAEDNTPGAQPHLHLDASTNDSENTSPVDVVSTVADTITGNAEKQPTSPSAEEEQENDGENQDLLTPNSSSVSETSGVPYSCNVGDDEDAEPTKLSPLHTSAELPANTTGDDVPIADNSSGILETVSAGHRGDITSDAAPLLLSDAPATLKDGSTTSESRDLESDVDSVQPGSDATSDDIPAAIGSSIAHETTGNFQKNGLPSPAISLPSIAPTSVEDAGGRGSRASRLITSVPQGFESKVDAVQRSEDSPSDNVSAVDISRNPETTGTGQKDNLPSPTTPTPYLSVASAYFQGDAEKGFQVLTVEPTTSEFQAHHPGVDAVQQASDIMSEDFSRDTGSDTLATGQNTEDRAVTDPETTNVLDDADDIKSQAWTDGLAGLESQNQQSDADAQLKKENAFEEVTFSIGGADSAVSSSEPNKLRQSEELHLDFTDDPLISGGEQNLNIYSHENRHNTTRNTVGEASAPAVIDGNQISTTPLSTNTKTKSTDEATRDDSDKLSLMDTPHDGGRHTVATGNLVDEASTPEILGAGNSDRDQSSAAPLSTDDQKELTGDEIQDVGDEIHPTHDSHFQEDMMTPDPLGDDFVQSTNLSGAGNVDEASTVIHLLDNPTKSVKSASDDTSLSDSHDGQHNMTAFQPQDDDSVQSTVPLEARNCTESYVAVPPLDVPTRSDSSSTSVDGVETKLLDIIDTQTPKLSGSRSGHGVLTAVESTATISQPEDEGNGLTKADTPVLSESESDASAKYFNGVESTIIGNSNALITLDEDDAGRDGPGYVQPPVPQSEDRDGLMQADALLSTDRKSDGAFPSGVDGVESQSWDTGHIAGEADTGRDAHTDFEPMILQLKERVDDSANDDTADEKTPAALGAGEVETSKEDVKFEVDGDVSILPIHKNTQAQTPNVALSKDTITHKDDFITKNQTQDLQHDGSDTSVDEVKQKHQTPPTDASSLDGNNTTGHAKAQPFGKDTQSEKIVSVDDMSSELVDDIQYQVGRDAADAITGSDALENSNSDETPLVTQFYDEHSEISVDVDQVHAGEGTKEVVTDWNVRGSEHCDYALLSSSTEARYPISIEYPDALTLRQKVKFPTLTTADGELGTSTENSASLSLPTTSSDVESNSFNIEGFENVKPSTQGLDGASTNDICPVQKDTASLSPSSISPVIVSDSSLETFQLATQDFDSKSTDHSAGWSPEDPVTLPFSSTSPGVVGNPYTLTTPKSAQVAEKYLDGTFTNNIRSSSEDTSSLHLSSISPPIIANLDSSTFDNTAQLAEQDFDGKSTNNSQFPSSKSSAVVSNWFSLTSTETPELATLSCDGTPTDVNPFRKSLPHGRGDTTLNVPADELASTVLNVAQGLLGRGFNRITGAQGSSNDVLQKGGEGQKLENRPVEPIATSVREDADVQQSLTLPQSSASLSGGNSPSCTDNISSSDKNNTVLSSLSTASGVAEKSTIELATLAINPLSHQPTSPRTTSHDESVNAIVNASIPECASSSLSRPPQSSPKSFSSGFAKLNTGELPSFIPTGVDRLWKSGDATLYALAGSVPSGADVIPGSALETATDDLDSARQPSQSVQGTPAGLKALQFDAEAQNQEQSDRVGEGHRGEESTSSITNELQSELEPVINDDVPRTGEYADEAATSTCVQKPDAENGTGRILSLGFPTASLPSVAMPSFAFPTVELAVKFPPFGISLRGKKPVAKPLVDKPSAGLPSVELPSVKLPSFARPSTPKTFVEKHIAAPAVENTSTGVPSAASPSVNMASFRQSSTANTSVEAPIVASNAEPSSSGTLIDVLSDSSNAEKKEAMLTNTWDTLTSAKFPSTQLPFVGGPFVSLPSVKLPSFGRPSTRKSPIETDSATDSALQRGIIYNNTPSGSPISENETSLFKKSWDNRSWSKWPSVGPPSPTVELPSFGLPTRRHASEPSIGHSNIWSSPIVIMDEPSRGGSIPCVGTTIPTMKNEKDTSLLLPDVQDVKVQVVSTQKFTTVSSDNDSQMTSTLLDADENKSHTQNPHSVQDLRGNTIMGDVLDQDTQLGPTMSTMGEIANHHYLAQVLNGDNTESNLRTKAIEQLCQLRDGIIASNQMLAHTALYSTVSLHGANTSASKTPDTNLSVISSASKGLCKGVTDQMLGIDVKKPSLFSDPIEGVRAIQRLNQMIAENSKALKSMDLFSSDGGSSKATMPGSKEKEESRKMSVGKKKDTTASQMVVAPEDTRQRKMKNTELEMSDNLEVKKEKLPCGLSPVIEQGETDVSEDGGEKILKQKIRATPLSTSAALDTGFTPKQRSSSDAPRIEPRSVFDTDLLPDDFLPPYFEGSLHCTEPRNTSPDRDFHDLITPVDATRHALHDEDVRQFSDFDYQGNLLEGSLASLHGSEADAIEQDWTMVLTNQFRKRAPSTYTTYTAYTMAEMCDDHQGECNHHSTSRKSTSYSAKSTLPDTKWPTTSSEIPFGGEASTFPSTNPKTPHLPSNTMMGISSSNTGMFTPPDSPEMKRLLGDTNATDTTDPYLFTRPRTSDSITLIEAAPLDMCPHCDAPHCDASSMDNPNTLTIDNKLADVLAVFEVMGLTLQVTVAGNAEHLSSEEIAATKETLKKRIQQVADVTNAGYRIKKKATWTRGKGDGQKEKEKEREKEREKEVAMQAGGRNGAQNPEGSPKGFSRLFGYGW